MKKINRYLLLAVGALGVLAISAKLTAADSPIPSCCMGGMTATMAADASAKPDLLTTCPVSNEKLGEMGILLLKHLMRCLWLHGSVYRMSRCLSNSLKRMSGMK